MIRKCYMCDAEGVTREHVPPFSFFPDGFKNNLWTVRSCKEHNISNSKDVEYVRNGIVSHRNCKGTAQELAQSVTFRSFERSAALFFRTFSGARPVFIDGEESAVYTFDLSRLRQVMKAIAFALYFRENGKSYEGDWHVFSPTLVSDTDLRGIPNKWQNLRDYLSTAPFILRATPEPAVFRYGLHIFDDNVHFAYALEFYGGFHVYVWTAPAEATEDTFDL
jgi:hypothetical protein